MGHSTLYFWRSGAISDNAKTVVRYIATHPDISLHEAMRSTEVSLSIEEMRRLSSREIIIRSGKKRLRNKRIAHTYRVNRTILQELFRESER